MELFLDILKNPIFPIFTGIFGYACGHYGIIIRHNSAKRKEIIERVLLVIEKLRREAEGDFRLVDGEYYQRSIVAISEAFSAFGPYISKRDLNKYKELMKMYKGKDSNYFNRGFQYALNAFRGDISGPNYIADHLNKFEQLALDLK